MLLILIDHHVAGVVGVGLAELGHLGGGVHVLLTLIDQVYLSSRTPVL